MNGFMTQKGMRHHYKHCMGGGQARCSACTEMFASPEDLVHHVDTEHTTPGIYIYMEMNIYTGIRLAG